MIHWEKVTTCITNINGKNLFNNYYRITETDVTTAKSDRTNDGAIQNTRALYKALQISLNEDIKNQMFSQIAKVPSVDFGVSLFFHMTELSMPSALQISMSAFNNILNFNLKVYNYHIPIINRLCTQKNI